ncbi:MAG: hypothetical protein JKY87_07365 [Mariprofundus sp.]|nr:hypothetical protein [Mariprofundus sp.]
MPVSKLRTFVPTSLMSWIDDEGNTLSGSLTMDMTGQQSWAVFGSMLLNNEATALAVNLRGKLSHPTAGQLIWKDSFIHLSDKAVIAITGSCKQHNCNTRLDAKNIALTRWQPFIPKGITFHRRISGLSNVAADLQWNEKTWQGKAAIKLKQASFQHADQNIVLPDLNLHIRELSGSSKAWQAQASISSDGLDGSIDVQSQQQANGKKHLEMKSKNAGSKLWQPLANLLLSSLNISPTLQANGNIQGSLHVHQNGQRKTLTLDVDATAAQIKASPWLKKQAGVTAICHATVQFTGTAAHRMNVSNCQLGASQVGQLNWAEKNAKQVLTVSKLDLNLAQLKIHEIPLPSLIETLSGEFKGSGKTSWTDNNPWTDNIHGDWQLINIGNTTWQANGDVRARKGVFNSKNLRLDGDFGQVELKGSYDVAKQRGNIDISSGKLDWSAPPALNPFWQKISLRGNIKPSELRLVHNNWHNLRSNYKLSQGTLSLQKLQADIAGGSISSDKLLLSPQSEGWRIQGNMRGKNIQLDQLQGLNTWIQADIRGTLHANIKLNGTFPQTNLQDWQRSNGDILIYSGNWQQQLPKESLTERLGIKAPALKTYAFRKLEFRFRIQPDQAAISGIRLLRHKQNYHGKASIKPDFHLSGSMQQQSDNSNYVIDSKIPYINWSMP